MSTGSIFRLAAVITAVVALGAAALSASAVGAARGGIHGGGQTAGAAITLDQTDPHLGDSVTFTTNAGSKVNVTCYQSGVGVVYAAEQPVGTAFLLGANSRWASLGGDADCIAWLFTRSLGDGFLAQTSFHAGGAR